MKRSSTILLGIVALLAIATYFVLRQPGEQSVEFSAGEPLVKYDSVAVDRVEIRSANGAVTIEKQGGKWMITAPVRYEADETAVGVVVGKGRDMKITSLVSTNPAKQGIYAVDSTGTLIKMFANNNELCVIRLGKPSSSWTETYVRKEGVDEVYLTEGALSATFVKTVNDWRNKTIFKTNQATLNAVKFQFGDTTFTLSKKDSVNWVVGSEAANSGNVSSFLSSLADLQADEFVDSTITAMPELTAAIDVAGSQLRFYKRSDNKYYVQSSAAPQWYVLQEWKANNLLKRKKDLAATS